MKQTPLEHKIAQITDPIIQDLGFAPFCVKIIGDASAQIVQIMAEDPATKRLGVDDCAKISKAVSAVLDVEDPISGKYRLEVSSPGIDRLLIKREHFESYIGFDAKIETDTPAENGQRKFRGILKALNGDTITLTTDQGDAEIHFNTITKAKLVLSDDLIKATAAL
ncbi:MAG: ribosome maturation factor RimP [Bdellovibrionales bacterium]